MTGTLTPDARIIPKLLPRLVTLQHKCNHLQSQESCPSLGLLKDVSPCLYCQNLQLYQKACNACNFDDGVTSWSCTSELLHLHESTIIMMIMMTHHGHVIQLLHALPWALSKGPIWCADLGCACVQVPLSRQREMHSQWLCMTHTHNSLGPRHRAQNLHVHADICCACVQVLTEGDAFTIALHDPRNAIAWALDVQHRTYKFMQMSAVHVCRS